jgi:hypothetical protein
MGLAGRAVDRQTSASAHPGEVNGAHSGAMVHCYEHNSRITEGVEGTARHPPLRWGCVQPSFPRGHEPHGAHRPHEDPPASQYLTWAGQSQEIQPSATGQHATLGVLLMRIANFQSIPDPGWRLHCGSGPRTRQTTWCCTAAYVAPVPLAGAAARSHDAHRGKLGPWHLSGPILRDHPLPRSANPSSTSPATRQWATLRYH